MASTTKEPGIAPETAAKAPEAMTAAVTSKSRRRWRRLRQLTKACSLVKPQDMCRGDSLHDGLPQSTHRQVAEADRIPQPIYLGIEVEVLETQQVVRYGLCTHDGSYTLDYYDEEIDVAHLGTTAEKVEFFEGHIIRKLKEYQGTMNYKAHLIGLGLRVCNTMCYDRHCSTMCIDYGKERIFHVYGSDAPSLSSRVWLELDAIPFVMRSKGHTLDERASTAVRQAVVTLSPQYPGNIPRVSVGYRNEVEVDCNSDVHLFDLEHYRAHCTEPTWHAVLAMAAELRAKNMRVSFFNSTPQGGGVALMRHALIRFCQHLQVNVHWYVTTPSPEVFSITKRKFHNVLQGVSPPNVRLEETDKAKWLEWTKMNVMRHWGGAEGPIMTSDVIVIDDPQGSGLIPWIRKLNPKARIVYRSHIEIRADLIRDDPEGPQAQTWDFLWSAIKQADLFVSHPVANFVPDDVPMENVVMMPAATDPLDGLNKPLDAFDVIYYQQVFNRLCYDQGSRRVDWGRPYITQVARFDPSKGIPDVLLAYQKLYQKFVDEMNGSIPESEDENGWHRVDETLKIERRLPQLIICGHGSVDDPDGTWVFEEAHCILDREGYRDLQAHVTIVRIPPCDQILNVVLRNAVCALQLSHREGFEVKITEAIAKGIPVVAYRAGGIPFQIRHGESGYLVPVGDTTAVADHVYSLCTDRALRDELAASAKANVGEEFFTVHNWANWAYVWLKVLEKPRGPPSEDEAARIAAATTQGVTRKRGEERDVEDGTNGIGVTGGREGRGKAGDDESSSVSSTISGSGSTGSDGEEVEYCLNVDGSHRVCVPELHRPRKNSMDVLGGGMWVKDLWRAEYCEGTTAEGVPKFKALHGHHLKAREANIWFGNLPTMRKQKLPPLEEIRQQDTKTMEAVRAAASTAFAAEASSPSAVPDTAADWARVTTKEGAGDQSEDEPAVAIVTEVRKRAMPSTDLPPPIGEVERGREEAQKAAASPAVDSTVTDSTLRMLAPLVPEGHKETEDEAQEAAAMLLGPLESKLKRESSQPAPPEPAPLPTVLLRGAAAAARGKEA